jgi:ribonuclease HI
MKLTTDKLEAGLNCGAINARQLAVLEMKWPPRRGWRRRLVGMEISEETYKTFLALKKQKRETPALKRLPVPSLDSSLTLCTIQFDGGTSNNIPSKGGYGIGYGSYQLNSGAVVRLSFGRAMSCNAAEVRTLTAAIEAATLIVDPAKTRLCVYGDSEIALKWARLAVQQALYQPKRGWSPGFTLAIAHLYLCLKPFAAVVTEWQPRERSVEIFGH